MKGILLAVIAIAFCPQATAAQVFHASEKGSQWVCSDKSIIPEIYDLTMHDPNNPQITMLAEQGNCSPILANFTVSSSETLQVPAGPQKIVQIAIPNLVNPAMPPETGWMMQSDIEPAH